MIYDTDVLFYVFPVCAGVILDLPFITLVSLGVPHVCGGDPTKETIIGLRLYVFPVCAGVILV